MQPKLSLIRANDNSPLFDHYIGSRLASYTGLAFEKLCLKNIDPILAALEIEFGELNYFGPYFRQAHRSKSIGPGFQIDIMLMRKRNILTLIECKFTEAPVDLQIIKDFERKVMTLKAPKKFSIEKVLISANGATEAVHESEYFHKILKIEDLLY
jgi:hypothetical protein